MSKNETGKLEMGSAPEQWSELVIRQQAASWVVLSKTHGKTFGSQDALFSLLCEIVYSSDTFHPQMQGGAGMQVLKTPWVSVSTSSAMRCDLTRWEESGEALAYGAEIHL